MKDQVIFYSSIPPEKKRSVLWKGSLMAAAGAFALIYFGEFFDPSNLETVGPWIFLIALFLVAKGLIPYKKLCRKETHPDELVLGTEGITYAPKRKVLCLVPWESIQDVQYRDGGIQLWIKEEFLAGHPELSSWVADCQKQFGSDLFFPDFHERAYKEIQLCL